MRRPRAWGRMVGVEGGFPQFGAVNTTLCDANKFSSQTGQRILHCETERLQVVMPTEVHALSTRVAQSRCV